MYAPLVARPVLVPTDCGLPLTPPSRVFVMLNEEQIVKGYDSNYPIGPFVERGLANENFVSIGEPPLEARKTPTVSPKGGVDRK